MIKKELREAAATAEEASDSRALELVARAGFAVSGVLHFLVGAIAIRLATGGEGQADVSGAVGELSSQPAGPLLLWSCFVACVALALWQTGDAVFHFNHLSGRQKLMKKLKAAGLAVVFVAFAVTLGSFALGARQDNGESASDLTVAVMKVPGGMVLLILVGTAVAVTGVVYAIRGFLQSFAKLLRWPTSAPARRAVKIVGIAGYAAKGAALLLVGLLIIIATVQAQPEESTGLDGGLRALREQPLGVYALASVGIGLACYGVFQAVRARFGKM
ncbi:DUF1206 domain-containing protein [Arthrobacter sp. R1-13]